MTDQAGAVAGGYPDRVRARLARVDIRNYGALIAFVVLFVTLSIASSHFLTKGNLSNILDQWGPLGMLTIGETICILAGVFDLSVGSMVSVTAVVGTKVAVHGSPTLGLLAAVFAGLGLGIVNGTVIHLTRINSFIGTLAMSVVYSGLAILITGGNTVTVIDPSFGTLGQGSFLGITYVGWFFLGFTAVAIVFIGRTTFGRYVYAVGGNQLAARLSGIRVDLIRGGCFAISGLAAGLAGMLLASRTQSAAADVGAGFELTAISAAVVGGTSIFGGDGAVWRGFLGIMLLALIGNGFNLLNINTTYQQIVQGGLILIAVAADQLLPAPHPMTLRAATDVGGTFTDLVYFVTDPDTGAQEVVTAKSDTTPPDYERGVLDVIDRSGVGAEEILSLAHGTTVVINALTERKGVLTGLITTEGFRDSLEIARGNRPDFFNLHYVKPPPFVPRYLRREVPGRLAQDGSERRPLELSGLEAIIDDFRAEGVQGIAICLLHSYANPAHEQAVLEAVRELWPEVSAVASHQITREWREYERTSTAVLSAYVQPIAERYLTRLTAGVRERGFAGQLYIMQSNCGVDSVDKTREIPITMVESGPASGVWGAAELGRLLDEPNIIALDIGGTTAKCSLIESGQVKIISDYWIERSRLSAGYPILVPVVDLVEIGQGGGSIAWVDEFGRLHVGPQSAGAVPGPAAYGKGGTEATTTDANLALGRINRDYFCGGQIQADMAAVDRVLRPIAERLGVDATEAAQAIVRIANNNMVNALKLVSLNRGYDPRDFTLVAFGGGGGMHAVALAAELGIRNVVIPRAAEVFSAWGMLMSDLRRDYFVTRLLTLTAENAAALDALLAEIIDRALKQFGEERVDPARISFLRYGKLRYENQEHSVEVLLPDGEIDPRATEEIADRFHTAYEREYTYRLDAPVEFVGAHVVAIADVGKLKPARLPANGRSLDEARKPDRSVDYATEGIHRASIYAGELLEPGMRFEGPAVVETAGSTIAVHPGNEVTVDDYGNLLITIP